MSIMSTAKLACVLGLLGVLGAAAFDENARERPNSRRLVETVTDKTLLTDGEKTVFQTASSTFGDPVLYPVAGWEVTDLTATLELDTAATYATNFAADRPGTWAPGQTRFNVSITLIKPGVQTGNVAAPALSARIRTQVCSAGNLTASFLATNNSVNSTDEYAAALGIESSSTNGSVSNSTIYNFLVDYDTAMSVVVYGDGQPIGCRNLRPPFPDFPNDWAATIEITSATQGYTFVMATTYSTTLNKIRLDVHSFGNPEILVTDAQAGQTTVINPGYGNCSTLPPNSITPLVTGDDNTTLLSTADMLRFASSKNVTYVPGFETVRGIPCEVWTYTAVVPQYNATTNVSFYFPINQWLVARESYHRLLKQIVLNGTQNGQPVLVYFEYVNFRPITAYAPLFETCAISPYGNNCNCTDALRRQAFANLTEAYTGDDDLGVSSAASAACQFGSPQGSPHGFISSQAGPYIGLVIIGMVAGTLITGAAMYLIYRKRFGVRILDNNLGHSRFTDSS